MENAKARITIVIECDEVPTKDTTKEMLSNMEDDISNNDVLRTAEDDAVPTFEVVTAKLELLQAVTVDLKD